MEWTHNICDDCWEERNPGRAPFKLDNRPPECCCFCNQIHRSGIYVRHDPDDPALRCKGDHDND